MGIIEENSSSTISAQVERVQAGDARALGALLAQHSDRLCPGTPCDFGCGWRSTPAVRILILKDFINSEFALTPPPAQVAFRSYKQRAKGLEPSTSSLGS